MFWYKQLSREIVGLPLRVCFVRTQKVPFAAHINSMQQHMSDFMRDGETRMSIAMKGTQIDLFANDNPAFEGIRYRVYFSQFCSRKNIEARPRPVVLKKIFNKT